MKILKEVTPQEIHERYLCRETKSALKRIQEAKEELKKLQSICTHGRIQAATDDDYRTDFAARRLCLECGKEVSKDAEAEYTKMVDLNAEVIKVNSDDFCLLRID